MLRHLSFSPLVLLVTLALLVSASSTAPAQSIQPGDVGVFADAAGSVTTADVTPGVPFNVYIVAGDLPDFYAYEVGLDGIPVGAFVLSTTLYGPAPLNVGDPVTNNYIVGTGGCVPGAGPHVLVNLSIFAGAGADADTAILLRGTQPSSFEGLPGYAECDGTTIGTFGVATDGGEQYPDGALILNATAEGPVSEDAESFGGLKARF